MFSSPSHLRDVTLTSPSRSGAIKNFWKCYNLLVPRTDVKMFPSGKHWDTIRRKTAFFKVIFCICQNVSQWQPLWSMLAFWIAQPPFPANSWWRLRWGGPINSRAPRAIWFLPLTEATAKTGLRVFTHSFTHSLPSSDPTHTRAHLAPWARSRFSLFNPHYSRGADSIWWVSEPRSVHLHTHAPTYLPFMWLLVVFCSFLF